MLSNYLISLLNLGAIEWRWQLGVAAVPAAVFFAMLFGIPRSARWLIAQERLDEAREVLKLMGSSDSETELADITRSRSISSATKRRTPRCLNAAMGGSAMESRSSW